MQKKGNMGGTEERQKPYRIQNHAKVPLNINILNATIKSRGNHIAKKSKILLYVFYEQYM